MLVNGVMHSKQSKIAHSKNTTQTAAIITVCKAVKIFLLEMTAYPTEAVIPNISLFYHPYQRNTSFKKNLKEYFCHALQYLHAGAAG